VHTKQIFYSRYMEEVLRLIEGASNASLMVTPDMDSDLFDYLKSLREGILETYISIVNGSSEATQNDKATLARYAQNILSFIIELLNSNETKYHHDMVSPLHLQFHISHSLSTKMWWASSETWLLTWAN
jgi:hypothetical protein